MGSEAGYVAELELEGGRAFVSHGGFVPRLVAYVLDATLVAIPHVAYLQAKGSVLRVLGLAVPFAAEPPTWRVWAVYAVATLAYFTVLEAIWGRTVGKRLAGIRVAGPHGDDVPPFGALLRNLYRLLYHLPVAGLVVLVLDGGLVLHRGRRLGDLAGETYVLKVADEW